MVRSMKKAIEGLSVILSVILAIVVLVIIYNDIQPNQNILDSDIWYLYFVVVFSIMLFLIFVITKMSSFGLDDSRVIYFSLIMALWLFSVLHYIRIYPLPQTPDNFLRGKSAELILKGYSLDTVLYGVYPGHLFISGSIATILDERILSSIVYYSVFVMEIVTVFLLIYVIEKYLKLSIGQVIFISMGFIVTATYYSPQYTGFLLFLLMYLFLIRYLDKKDNRFVFLVLLSYSSLVMTHPTTSTIGFFVIVFTYFCRYILRKDAKLKRIDSKKGTWMVLVMLLLLGTYTIYVSAPYVEIVLKGLVFFLERHLKLNSLLFQSRTSEIPILLKNYKVGGILFVYRLIYLSLFFLIFLLYITKIRTRLYSMISTNPTFCYLSAGATAVGIAILGIYILVPRYWARGILFGSLFLAFAVSFALFNIQQTHNNKLNIRLLLALSLVSFFLIYPTVIPSPYTVVTYNHIQALKFLPDNAEFVGTWDDGSIYSYYHSGNRKNAHYPQNYSSSGLWYRTYTGKDGKVSYIPISVDEHYWVYLERRYNVDIPWKKIKIYNTIIHNKIYDNIKFFVYFVK